MRKDHDKKVCLTNCKDNGETFNQTPHQCRYYSGSQKYQRLLEFHKISTDDSSGGCVTSSSQTIRDFCLQLILLEDYKGEFNSGYRKEEDITEVENAVDTL